MTEKKNHINKKITLENIKKSELFKVSEGYFDDLPTRIQSRIIASEEKRNPVVMLSKSMKFALPLIALVIMTIYFGNRFQANEIDIQALINEVSTEELVAYLNESEISTDDIIALIDVEELDIDGMLSEDIKLLDDMEFDAILDEYPDIETDFNDEF